MRLRFESIVSLSAGEVWALEKDVSRLDQVSRPLLSLNLLPQAESTWREGGVYRFEIKIFCLIPWAVHEVRMVRYCDQTYTFETDESGGPIKVWKHTHQVLPLDPVRSICRDEIEIQAGVFSPLVWIIAQALYRKRHRALRQANA